MTYDILTHITLDKMAAILTDDTFKCIFLNEMIEFRFEFPWNLYVALGEMS